MRVLIIKTSSMGDVIHTLPALTDAAAAFPDARFDWMVEESFAEIPAWHPRVERVIPIAFRRWRKSWWTARHEWKLFRRALREEPYDFIIDLQGLVKSAFLGWFAKGQRIGLDRQSAREPLASFLYHKTVKVNFYQQAVTRMRLLMSQALGYSMPDTPPDFGLDKSNFHAEMGAPYLVFLHGTTWESKTWPETYWQALARLAEQAGLRVKLTGGNEHEMARAHRIASASSVVDVLPRRTIGEMAALLSGSVGAVAVDTGFGHLAGALNLPTVSIYGSTNPEFTGVIGEKAMNLAAHFPCSPCMNRECTYKQPSEVVPACYATVPPGRVFDTLSTIR